MARCDLRSHRECACEPGECRVQHLGAFETTRAATDRRLVEAMHDHRNMARASIAMMTVAALLSMALIRAYSVECRNAQIEQEQFSWNR